MSWTEGFRSAASGTRVEVRSKFDQQWVGGFEVAEEATSGSEAERYAYTPTLGVFHAITGLHGDILIPEDRIKHAITTAALGGGDIVDSLADLLGSAWDAELEPFRHAGDGAPVRWLHQVV